MKTHKWQLREAKNFLFEVVRKAREEGLQTITLRGVDRVLNPPCSRASPMPIQEELRLKSAQIEALCKRYHVKQLDIFGSALGSEFDVATSDLDLLVEFKDLPPAAYAEAYFGLLQELERLFSRPVDLVTAPSLTNPYFKQRVEETKAPLYAA